MFLSVFTFFKHVFHHVTSSDLIKVFLHHLKAGVSSLFSELSTVFSLQWVKLQFLRASPGCCWTLLTRFWYIASLCVIALDKISIPSASYFSLCTKVIVFSPSAFHSFIYTIFLTPSVFFLIFSSTYLLSLWTRTFQFSSDLCFSSLSDSFSHSLQVNCAKAALLSSAGRPPFFTESNVSFHRLSPAILSAVSPQYTHTHTHTHIITLCKYMTDQSIGSQWLFAWLEKNMVALLTNWFLV